MNESRLKNTSKNLIYAIVFQIVKLVLVFANRIIFVQKLGAEYLGVNGLFSNVLGVLSLADLGMTTAMMYALYEPLAHRDESKIRKYMNYFRKIYNIIGLVVAVGGILLLPFLKYLINLPSDMPNIYLYYILLLINTAISYLFVYKTTLISADQKMYILNKYDTIFQFILFILQAVVLLLTNSFSLYLICNILCTFLSNIFKVRKTESVYPYLKEKEQLELSKEEKKSIFENLKSLFLYKIGGVIQNNTDNILISVFVGTISVGYYSNYCTIILAVQSFLTMIFTSLKASIGNYIVNKSKEEQLRMFNILEVCNFWIVSFCTICFMILIPDFINICFGKDYILGFGLLVCVSLNFYTSNIRQTIWTFRETTGIFNKTKYITLVTSALNIVLSVIFGYKFGLIGIVGATIISRLLYAWWREPMILFGEYFKTSPKNYYFTYIKRLIFMILIFICANAICSIIPQNNIYFAFLLKCVICIFIPNIIIFIVFYKTKEFQYIKSNLKKLVKRG